MARFSSRQLEFGPLRGPMQALRRRKHRALPTRRANEGARPVHRGAASASPNPLRGGARISVKALHCGNNRKLQIVGFFAGAKRNFLSR
jgi:hypothetical protein